jgi:tetratricopeptide (TPR) repeat protein
MNLTRHLNHRIADPDISRSERARLRCRLAKQLQEEGNFETALEAMGELWEGLGKRPAVEGLDAESNAEVLLRAGTLTGWIGSAQQIEGAQEWAKNLISESQRMFETLGRTSKAAEAKADLAVCYWREGALDEARVMLHESLGELTDTDAELKAVGFLRLGLVERSAKRFNDALRIHAEAAQLFDKLGNHLLKAQFHIGFANLLNHLRTAENRANYADRALIEYAAASFHFEQAGHTRYQACVENNLGFLFGSIGKFIEAHEHLDRAQMLFTGLKDDVHLAQVDETRARVMLAEGRVVEAEKTVRAAVRTLEKGDEQSLLVEALTTQSTALARLKHPEQSRAMLERAIEVAERAGDLESAGNAAMVMIEELDAFLSNDDLKATVDRARTLLANTQELSTLKRLTECASRVLSRVHDRPGLPRSVDWSDFSFKRAILRYEAHFIRLALDAAGGVVSRAARLLGFNHHQSLLALLNARHKNLRDRSTPLIPRRRSIIQTRDRVVKSRNRNG